MIPSSLQGLGSIFLIICLSLELKYRYFWSFIYGHSIKDVIILLATFINSRRKYCRLGSYWEGRKTVNSMMIAGLICYDFLAFLAIVAKGVAISISSFLLTNERNSRFYSCSPQEKMCVYQCFGIYDSRDYGLRVSLIGGIYKTS